MEWMYLFAALAIAAIAALAFVLAGRRRSDMGEATEKLLAAQTELSGRLSQMAESGAAAQAELSKTLQAQERAISKAMEERLADLTRRVGVNLQQNTEKTAENLSEVKQRLAVIDAAQKSITELSGQMMGLQDILSNKQARGAFGEVQLEDLVRGALPPSAYEFQVTLGNNKRADCLLKFPNPTGAIAVDAKFPLESYRAMHDADDDQARIRARRAFSADVLKHVSDIADKYIIPGETAENALMFLPAESVYAELHANFQDVVEKSHRARVYVVSPTTMMATLTTMRAILKDAHMREQAGVIQQEVGKMMVDVGRLDKRVGNLQRHFDQAAEDLREIRTSTEKVTRRGEQIEELEMDEDEISERPAAVAEVRRLEPGRG